MCQTYPGFVFVVSSSFQLRDMFYKSQGHIFVFEAINHMEKCPEADRWLMEITCGEPRVGEGEQEGEREGDSQGGGEEWSEGIVDGEVEGNGGLEIEADGEASFTFGAFGR